MSVEEGRRLSSRDAGIFPPDPSRPDSVRAMFDRIAERYELMNHLLTFGLDRRWRSRAVTALDLPRGALVLDLACGTGDMCRELARQGLRPVGVDFSEGMLRSARSPGPLVMADAMRLPFLDDTFDGVTCAFALRNVEDQSRLFAEAARVLRPGGRMAVLEVCRPESALARIGHRVWFDGAVPLIGGVLSDSAAYRYLPRSTVRLPDVGELDALLTEAGFVEFRRTVLTLGAVQVFTARKSPGETR